MGRHRIEIEFEADAETAEDFYHDVAAYVYGKATRAPYWHLVHVDTRDVEMTSVVPDPPT